MGTEISRVTSTLKIFVVKKLMHNQFAYLCMTLYIQVVIYLSYRIYIILFIMHVQTLLGGPRRNHPSKSGVAPQHILGINNQRFKNSFLIDQYSTNSDANINKYMGVSLSNFLMQFSEKHRNIIPDLEPVYKIKEANNQDHPSQCEQNILIQKGIKKALKVSLSRNNYIQKQQKLYSQLYKISSKHRIKEHSVLAKLMSINVQQFNSFQKTNKLFPKVSKDPSLTRTLQHKSTNNNVRLLSISQNGRMSTHNNIYSTTQTSLDQRSVSSLRYDQSIFRNRRLKYCNPCFKTIDSKIVDFNFQSKPDIKFIQIKIDNDSFRILAPNKVFYKKKKNTFGK